MLAVPRKLRGNVVICPGCRNRCRVPGAADEATLAEIPHGPEPGELPLYSVADHSWTRMLVVASVAAAIVAVGALVLDRALDRSSAEAGGDADQQIAVPVSSLGPSSDQPALAEAAKAVLAKHCYQCHGQDGAAEGNFNSVLQRDRLVAGSRYINPGNADQSRLLKRIVNKEMPPPGEEPLPPEAIEALRNWIAAGAPDFDLPPTREFISNADLIHFIRLDLEQLPERQHRHTRYFTLTNLYNAGYSQDEMRTYRLALSKLVNSLSWHQKIVHPQPIDPGQTIFRIDVRTLGWDDAVWEKIIEANPYSVKLYADTPDGQFCLDATQCEVPHVRADWFVAAASRPPLYHEALQLPATLKELLAKRFPEVDLEKDVRQESVARVGMSKSGVSQNNRLIEFHRASSGYFWVSYDFAGNTGRKNLFRHPLGPGSDENHFEHDGGEIIFSLPNGLQGYMLVDAKGNRIEKAPTSIVTDPKRPDSAVTNGVSCMSCHYGGIIAKADEVRPTVEANRLGFRDDAETILALYPRQADLEKLFAENAGQFRRAVEEVGVTLISQTNEPVVNMALRFEADVDLVAAAAEFGLKPEDFATRLKANPRVQDRLGPLNVAGGSVKRELFAKEFVFVVEELRLGVGLASSAGSTPLPSTPVDQPPPSPEPQSTPDLQKALGEKLANSAANEKVVAPAASAPAEAKSPGLRSWSDNTGKAQVDAELIDLIDSKVVMRMADGTVLHVPLDQLSAADQQFVAETLSERERTEPPPAEALGQLDRPVQAARPPAAQPTAHFRNWTNLRLRKSVPGAFVYLRHGELKLEDQRFRGAFILWPMHDMSPEDHDFVRSVMGDLEYALHRQSSPRRANPFQSY
jgi:mono/diheme cytochrome c family protein